MATLIGDRLPRELLEAFDGDRLETKIGPAYLLLTADEDGTPRPCMLSAGEILAPDDRALRFALWPKSSTGANLDRGARGLFCHVAPGSVLYVRGPTRRIEPAAETSLDCFELEVESVESDAHAGMPVTSGIEFAATRSESARVAEAWRRQLDPLRGR
ncbi:MAG TPA: hypothetical protein VFI37_15770 [Gaiellaceae bacterium]|jgi:hypothetical protein|nr:hypothetical protein [Gaiellaceae bacterium]